MQRLRPLSEEECYLRIYGQRDDGTVRVVRRAPRDDSFGAIVLAERIRIAFETRLVAREPEAA